MICHTDGCLTAHEEDEFGRPMSVAIDWRTQPGLGATGHHVVNRVYDGTIETHVRGWTPVERQRAIDQIEQERVRMRAYLSVLETAQHALAHSR